MGLMEDGNPQIHWRVRVLSLSALLSHILPTNKFIPAPDSGTSPVPIQRGQCQTSILSPAQTFILACTWWGKKSESQVGQAYKHFTN